MSDKKMYDILGIFKNLDPKMTPVKEDVKTEPTYENVEPRGSIMEAVKSLHEKYMGFKKMGEDAKPDFLDLDDDGDTDEPMKDAAKDAEPAATDKSKAEKRKRLQALKDKQEDERAEKGDYDDKKSSARVVKGRAYGGSAQKDDDKDDLDEAMSDEEKLERYHELIKKGMDPDDAEVEVFNDEDDEDLDEAGYSAKAARAGKDIGKPGKQFSKIAKDAAKRYGSKERGEKVAGAVLAKLRGKEEMDEVAPPGAKAERMVKHIKKGYAKDGKLSKKEKGIAYATAWKAHKAGKLQESRMMEDSDYMYERIGKALAEKNPTLNTANPEFKTAVRKEMVAQGMDVNRARNIIDLDEDFIGDVATSYAHNCKEIAECGNPINSFVQEDPILNAQQELDEIARLAGLPVEETETYSQVNTEESPDTMDEGNAFTAKLAQTRKGEKFELDGKEYTDTSDLGESALEEEEMGEGNEFSGALAKARAEGKKEFEVDGKKYTVKEDVNINISANGEEDAMNLIRKLAGMPEVKTPVQANDEGEEVEVAEERDVEYTNTPREETAGVDAAIPAGADLNRAKKQYKKEYPGDNPMAVKEEALWKAYESLISEIKD